MTNDDVLLARARKAAKLALTMTVIMVLFISAVLGLLWVGAFFGGLVGFVCGALLIVFVVLWLAAWMDLRDGAA